MIYLGSDHGGYELKEKIKQNFDRRGVSYVDMGPTELDPEDDYPDFAAAVARRVAKSKKDRGILICRSSNGMAMAANKVKGIRAGIAWNTETAEKSVEHNHANVLCLSADGVSKSQNIKIITAWQKARPSKVSRHVRRVKKINKLD